MSALSSKRCIVKIKIFKSSETIFFPSKTILHEYRTKNKFNLNCIPAIYFKKKSRYFTEKTYKLSSGVPGIKKTFCKDIWCSNMQNHSFLLNVTCGLCTFMCLFVHRETHGYFSSTFNWILINM